jgi:hypothetical protein
MVVRPFPTLTSVQCWLASVVGSFTCIKETCRKKSKPINQPTK